MLYSLVESAVFTYSIMREHGILQRGHGYLAILLNQTGLTLPRFSKHYVTCYIVAVSVHLIMISYSIIP